MHCRVDSLDASQLRSVFCALHIACVVTRLSVVLEIPWSLQKWQLADLDVLARPPAPTAAGAAAYVSDVPVAAVHAHAAAE